MNFNPQVRASAALECFSPILISNIKSTLKTCSTNSGSNDYWVPFSILYREISPSAWVSLNGRARHDILRVILKLLKDVGDVEYHPNEVLNSWRPKE